MFIPYTDLNSLLNSWAQAGILSILVVFILVFAIVFAILQKSGILGRSKGVDAVIALALALGALQFDWVTQAFYIKFFANFGVGLIIMIAALILVGLIAGEGNTKPWNVLIAVFGAIIFLAVLISSKLYTPSVWGANDFLTVYGGYLVLAVIVIGIIVLVVLTSKPQASTVK